jgi:molybdenum cofactor biosynthesis protein B
MNRPEDLEMSTAEHRAEAPRTIRYVVITVSNTCEKATDPCGQIIIGSLKEKGYECGCYEVIPDEPEQIVQLIRTAAKMQPPIDAILINGGTGIAGRDNTFEAVDGLLEKRIPGFGELFRYLSFVEDIGAASMLCRATAGVYRRMAIFSMPGSKGAVQLAMSRLIVPELAQVVSEIRKDRPISRKET